MKQFISKYKHAWVMIAYLPIYMIWWMWLERRTNVFYHPVETALDSVIPFNEFFVIPYFVWFAYIAGAVLYFFFTDKESYFKACAFLFIGMTVCLAIYTIWPNMQNLRPSSFARDNIFTRVVAFLYQTDTSTNVCPSIHVYNSIGVHIAVTKSQKLRNLFWLRLGSLITCVSICLSTVFLKQHSVFDGVCALLLSFVLYLIVYVPDYSGAFRSKEVHGRDTVRRTV